MRLLREVADMIMIVGDGSPSGIRGSIDTEAAMSETNVTVVYFVRCIDCGELRYGEKELGKSVEPFQAECPNCGALEYTIPAFE